MNDIRAEIWHYASPYYDPVKAHEYYMKNRELKNRRSTSGLNEEGRNAARYVKEQLNAERNKKISDHKEATDSSIKRGKEVTTSNIKANTERTNTQIESNRVSKDAKLEQHKTQMNSKISGLRDKLKNMSKEEKAKYESQKSTVKYFDLKNILLQIVDVKSILPLNIKQYRDYQLDITDFAKEMTDFFKKHLN